MGTWVTEEMVEEALQLKFTGDSYPNITAVTRWIEQVEAEISDRALGSHSASEMYLDVSPQGLGVADYTPLYYAETGRLVIGLSGGVIVPIDPFDVPIISITKLYTNDSDPSLAPAWVQRTEGPAAGSSFFLLKGGSKQRGYLLYFYDNFPVEGYKRIKMECVYGWNVSISILGRWGTLKVAVEVLRAMRGTSQNPGLTEFVSGSVGSFIPSNYTSRIEEMKAEIAKIEYDFFPREIAVGIV